MRAVYYRLPLFVPGLRCFVRLDTLDGPSGFVFHFLRAVWCRLAVDVPVKELLAAKAGR